MQYSHNFVYIWLSWQLCLLHWKFWQHTFIRGPQKTYYSQLKFLNFLHRTEISAILADVCLNSVAMVTLFDPLKIPIIYVNSLTPKTLLFTRKISQYFIQYKVKFVQFWLVFAHLVAIATLFTPWKIQRAYLNSTTPKPYHIRKNWHYIAYRTEICAFLDFFSVNLVAMATPFAL